jgi:hypothetical protein
VNGDERGFNYFVTSRGSNSFNRVTYFGSGLFLEIDLWPDNRPQWGRNYRSTLRATDIQNPEIQNVNCTFPNAF